MTRALSTDLRQRTLAAVASGVSRRAAAARFGVSSSSVIRWVAEWRASGRDHALTQGGDRRSHWIEAWSDFLLAEVEAQGDISLVELADRLATTHGVRFAPSTIWRCLDRHAMTIKKIAHASEQTRPDVAARRETGFENQPDLDPERLALTCLRECNHLKVESDREGYGRMKRSRFTEEQIIGILKEQEAGLKVSDLCRKHVISDATFYK